MSDITLSQCLLALQKVVQHNSKFVPLHEPDFSGNEREYIQVCLDSGWVSSVGSYVDRFEEKLSEYTNLPFCVLTVNGTAALHLSLVLAGVQPHDEVLVPSLSFVATANVIAYQHAIPHFVDSHEKNLGIDLDKLSQYLKDITEVKAGICQNKITGRAIKAILPVDGYGHPVEMDLLREIVSPFGLTVIEDASEALGSYYQGSHVGQYSDLTVFSFNGNKIMTTGGGGALLIKNKNLARQAKHLSTTAKLQHHWEYEHDAVGYNYRMPNINAALGLAQLEQMSTYLEYKRTLADRYRDAFKSISFLKVLRELPSSKSNYWLNALILQEPNKDFVDRFITLAHQHNYGLRPLWQPLDRLPMYDTCPKMDCSQTHALYERVITLPSSAQLGKYDA